MEFKHRSPPKLPPIKKTYSIDNNFSNKINKPLPPISPKLSQENILNRDIERYRPSSLSISSQSSVSTISNSVSSNNSTINNKIHLPRISPINIIKSPIWPVYNRSPKSPKVPIYRKNLFMSHTWRYDELNRDTHDRVKQISNALQDIGYTTWFDEDDMVNGNIDISMADGIDNCDCFIVCLTKNYIEKINEASKNMLIRDNCYKEFNYANVSNKIMIPLILEPGIKKLPGIIGLYLGNQYFIDFSFSDYKSKEFNKSIEKLDIALKKYKIIENSMKKHIEQISKFKSKLYNTIHMYSNIGLLIKSKLFIKKEDKTNILNKKPSFRKIYREIINL